MTLGDPRGGGGLSAPGACCPDDAQAEALALYDLGLHVFPLPRGRKTPFGPHRKLHTSRLDRGLLPAVCAGCNLAVFAGRLSRGLCVLDCDTAADFQAIRDAFWARGLRPWLRGGTNGGGQVWFRVDDGEVTDAVLGPDDAAAVVTKVEVLGHDLYALVPPSVHPDSGEVYEWVARDTHEPPVIALAEIRFLPLRRRTARRRRPRRSEKMDVLPPVAETVLIERDAAGYRSHSEAEYAACLSMILASYPDDHILHLLEQIRPPHYHKTGQRNFARHVLASARAWAEEHPLDAGRANVPTVASWAYVAWAWSRPWPGRTGNTDCAVFLALCERLRMESGVMPVRGSIREVAELAGVSRDTAHRALGRLGEQGLICVHVEEDAAYRYDLTVDVGQGLTAAWAHGVAHVPDSRPLQGCRTASYCHSDGPPLEAHDAWQPGALGKSACAVWTALQDLPRQTTGQLVTQTGRGRSTVKRVLGLLTLHGLVTSTDDRHRAMDVATEELDKIASLYGTAGTAARRKAQHSRERALYVTHDLLSQQERHRQPPADHGAKPSHCQGSGSVVNGVTWTAPTATDGSNK